MVNVRTGIILIPKYKLAYIRCSKNASTSTMLTLAHLEGKNLENMNVHQANRDGVFGEIIYKWEQIPHDYNKFTVIRNPYERAVSCYINWIEKPRELNKISHVGKLYGINKNNFNEFNYEDFIDGAIKRDEVRKLDPHMMRQYENCNVEQLNTIIRFENYEKEFKSKILDNLNVNYKLYHINKSKPYNYRDYYTQNILDKFNQLYKNDVEKLGYGWYNVKSK
ncbi:MAG: hypothetical protein GF350_02610 [Chitinivibrionales bacterium]|nr:hypothetical protein [Chitinivibrionales bacterium]